MTATQDRTQESASDWIRCTCCGQVLYQRRLEDNLGVCPDCGDHQRLDAPGRMAMLFDEGSVQNLDVRLDFADSLQFVDTRPYVDRWHAAQRTTAMAEAVIVARGSIHGHPVITAVMDFRFLGGSLGAAVGELVTLAAEVALRERTPLLLVTASGGARMQEGVLSLMQMAKTAHAMGRLDRAGVRTISLITDPTFGGVAASFATLTDVVVAEPAARMGFAGPRVIERTIRQTLPEGFQTAEYLLEHGLIDAIRTRHQLRPFLSRILAPTSRPSSGLQAPQSRTGVLIAQEDLPELPSWEAVRRARDLGRPTTTEYLARVFDDFVELRGDRATGDCPALVGGVARLDGTTVVVLGHQKGHTPAELAAHNYGMATPAGYRKSARLARLAAKWGIPVITFVDTPGAFPGVEAEQQGQSMAIAENLRLFADLPVAVITLICGEGGSGGALALAVADRVLMCTNAVYSVISPEGCAAILWDDPAAAPRAAAAMQVDARQLLAAGFVDGVVPEPPGGAQADHPEAFRLVRDALLDSLDRLRAVDPATLVADRNAKFRHFGANRVIVRGHA